jgi:hypothetical protein
VIREKYGGSVNSWTIWRLSSKKSSSSRKRIFNRREHIHEIMFQRDPAEPLYDDPNFASSSIATLHLTGKESREAIRRRQANDGVSLALALIGTHRTTTLAHAARVVDKFMEYTARGFHRVHFKTLVDKSVN